jgi:hypothetical protein
MKHVIEYSVDDILLSFNYLGLVLQSFIYF